MNKQTQYQGVDRRKKPRAPIEVIRPEKPQSGRRSVLLVAALVLAIAGLLGFFAIFWMGASGQL